MLDQRKVKSFGEVVEKAETEGLIVLALTSRITASFAEERPSRVRGYKLRSSGTWDGGSVQEDSVMR